MIEEEETMGNEYKYWGKLENGEAVFIGEGGEATVEKDRRHLVTPTPEEKQEIFRTWPGLIDMHLEQERFSGGVDKPLVGALRDKITGLEFEARDDKRVIAALKYANDERDKMIKSLMDDIVEFKSRIETLHDTNRKWKEEVKRRDDTIEVLVEECKDLTYSGRL